MNKTEKSKFLNIIPIVLAFVLIFPIFIHIGTYGISLGKSVWTGFKYPGIDFPLSVFVIPSVLLILIIYKRRILLNVTDRLVILFVLINVISYLLGILVNIYFYKVSDINEIFIGLFFLFQTILPISSYFVIRFLISGKENQGIWIIENLSSWLMVFGIISLFLLFVQSLIDKSVNEILSSGLVDYFGPIYVTKIKRYYPAMLTTSGTLFLSRFIFEKKAIFKTIIDLICALFIIALIPLIWSRIAFAMVLGATAFLIIISFSCRKFHSSYFVLFSLFVILIVAITFFAIEYFDLSNIKVVDRMLSMFNPTSSVSSGDSNRLSGMRKGLMDSLISPFGNLFLPKMNYSLSGIRYSFPRIGMPENTYLDISQRAGLISLMVFITISVIVFYEYASIVFIRNKSPLNRDIGWFEKGYLSIWLSLFLISNMTQHNFTEPYAAMYFWFILGMMDQYSRVKRTRKINKV